MIFLKIFKAFIIVIFTLAEYVKPYFFFLQNNLYFFLFSILLIIFVFIFIYILRFLYKKFNLYFAKYFYIKINNKYKIKLAAITVAPGLLLIIGADSLINNEFAENIQIIGDRFVSFVKLITDYAATLDLELPKPSVSGNGVWSLEKMPPFHLCKPFIPYNEVVLAVKYSSESHWVAATLRDKGINIPPSYLEHKVSIIARIISENNTMKEIRLFWHPNGHFGSVRNISENPITNPQMSCDMVTFLRLQMQIEHDTLRYKIDNKLMASLFNLNHNLASNPSNLDALSNVRNSYLSNTSNLSNPSNPSSEGSWNTLMQYIRNSAYTNSSNNLESVHSSNTSSSNLDSVYSNNGSYEDIANTLNPRPTSQVYSGNREYTDSPTLPDNYLSDDDNNVSENSSQISVNSTRSRRSVNTFGGR